MGLQAPPRFIVPDLDAVAAGKDFRSKAEDIDFHAPGLFSVFTGSKVSLIFFCYSFRILLIIIITDLDIIVLIPGNWIFMISGP